MGDHAVAGELGGVGDRSAKSVVGFIPCRHAIGQDSCRSPVQLRSIATACGTPLRSSWSRMSGTAWGGLRRLSAMRCDAPHRKPLAVEMDLVDDELVGSSGFDVPRCQVRRWEVAAVVGAAPAACQWDPW